VPAVQRQHLLTQLARPCPFGLPRSLHPEPRPLLTAQRLFTIADPALQLVLFRLGVRQRSLQFAGTLL
jgi:hypothetical protein